MNVTYAIEPFHAFWAESATLLKSHWAEVAMDQEAIPYEPDVSQYDLLERMGSLQIMVARSDGELVGYHVSIIKPHIHYKTRLHAFVDVYYVHPEHRKGMTGYMLFRAAERAWERRGVKKAVTGNKLHTSDVTGKTLDISPILKRQGWRETERTHTKCIGG